MTICSNIRIRLEPSLTQATMLAETSRQFTAVFNAVRLWLAAEREERDRAPCVVLSGQSRLSALVSDPHAGASKPPRQSARSRPTRWPEGQSTTLLPARRATTFTPTGSIGKAKPCVCRLWAGGRRSVFVFPPSAPSMRVIPPIPPIWLSGGIGGCISSRGSCPTGRAD